MLKRKRQSVARARRLTNAQPTAQSTRAVALLLVALFVAAASHELVFALYGHDHDCETCPFCILIHTPLLLALCAVALSVFLAERSSAISTREAPATRRLALQPDPRAPPLR